MPRYIQEFSSGSSLQLIQFLFPQSNQWGTSVECNFPQLKLSTVDIIFFPSIQSMRTLSRVQFSNSAD